MTERTRNDAMTAIPAQPPASADGSSQGSTRGPDDGAGLLADRRSVLLGAAVVAGGVTLAACSSSDDSNGDSNGESEGPLATVDDIPDGSALVVDSRQGPLVLVRDGGSVSALTAVCTHQACTVRVSGSELPCPCHGSIFALDGSVLRAPASEPLAAVPVVVVNDEVRLA